MALIAAEGTKRTPAPEGTHLANCFGLIDLGTQTGNIMGKVKSNHKVWLWWELCHERTEEGKPVTVGSFYTVSLDDRSNMRAILQSWRGKPFTPEELKAFQLRNIVGAACMLTIIHEPKKSGGGVTDKVKTVTGLPKGTQRAQLVTPTVVLDLDAFEQTTFDGLPNFLKDMIAKSPEGVKAGAVGSQPQQQGPRGGGQWPDKPADDYDANGNPIRNGVTSFSQEPDDDIPF